MLPVLNLQAPVGVERFVFRAPCIFDDTSLTFWSGMSGTTDPGHALPGRVAASESSSTGPDTSTLMKKPAAKTSKKKTEEEEPVGTDHEPLGGKDDEDDDEDSGDGAGSHEHVPLDLKPSGESGVKKKPATNRRGAQKKPSKRSRKNEDCC